MNFEEAAEKILRLEGGYVNHPADKGGPTRFGITKETARNYGYEGDIKKLPKKIAIKIYKHRYYKNYDIDKIEHDNIACRVFTFGVNAGTRTAIKALQKAYNLLTDNDIVADGYIGPETLTAVNNYDKPNCLLNTLKAIQAEYYLDIVRNDDSQHVFLAGWLNRVFEE